MPHVNELYEQVLGGSFDEAALRIAFCPFSQKPCDGDSNRDMAHWKADERQPLRLASELISGGPLQCQIRN